MSFLFYFICLPSFCPKKKKQNKTKFANVAQSESKSNWNLPPWRPYSPFVFFFDLTYIKPIGCLFQTLNSLQSTLSDCCNFVLEKGSLLYKQVSLYKLIQTVLRSILWMIFHFILVLITSNVGTNCVECTTFSSVISRVWSFGVLIYVTKYYVVLLIQESTS